MSRRPAVAVTGLGVRCAAGATPAALWESLLARRPAISLHTFDDEGTVVGPASAMTGFDPAGYLSPKEVRRADRSAQLAVCAAADAAEDAGGLQVPPGRRAVVTGTAYGGVVSQEDGIGRPDVLYVPRLMNNAGAYWVGARLGITGPSLTLSTACASGTHAVGEAMRMIWSGCADVVLAGGHDSALTPTTAQAFGRSGAMVTETDEPAAASRPFDVARRGFVLAEGAAFLVLERLDHARARGARVHATLTGYGRNSDAHHLTAPHPDGEGARVCMEQALADAGTTAHAVTHVNAHGTGTELNDLAEARAIAALFGPAAVPVTAPKAVTGHALGAAGALEAVITALSVREGLAPPTASLTRQDPRCAIDVVTTEPRKISNGPVISNSFAFGGHNACVVFDAPHD
ncbi:MULTISPECIES: beta-ketoacyl-[acyl-carrier-protein] synthase family protein [Streptomyces]|uniref:beta-ketoacyl-[acyl-carrier-protein] synthase family protein n=1 Tax=Streptomyces TaxID=1883 RepID=UPI001E2E754E|nr:MULTISPECIES: beta-ketoacyl-[acyl-carrier-protein] synthase family protein [Streptomyces]UFQ13669.1 beta-ketoacyl-[acyl-carrier-protein] synthase family protein [Streptomyces huasconensis]WCL83264.1 beta-ketoacyl-[acyl-carrier-protein] synthase family protein [Streptomyces sp. JCM 35825]